MMIILKFNSQHNWGRGGSIWAQESLIWHCIGYSFEHWSLWGKCLRPLLGFAKLLVLLHFCILGEVGQMTRSSSLTPIYLESCIKAIQLYVAWMLEVSHIFVNNIFHHQIWNMCRRSKVSGSYVVTLLNKTSILNGV